MSTKNVEQAAVKPTSIQEYISGFPNEVKLLLESIRETIKKAAPGAEETISYAIPAFKLNGRPFIYFAGFKNHIGMYPVSKENEEFKEELSTYKGGKGTVQFPLDKPIPLDLIARIVQLKVKENEQAVLKKKK